jgi:hypothetical protein
MRQGEIAMPIKHLPSKCLRIGLALAVVLGTAGTALADNSWEQSREHRTEVNERLAHRDARIDAERREHEAAARQDRAVHRNEVRTREEERVMAEREHRRLSHQEQERLEHRERIENR